MDEDEFEVWNAERGSSGDEVTELDHLRLMIGSVYLVRDDASPHIVEVLGALLNIEKVRDVLAEVADDLLRNLHSAECGKIGFETRMRSLGNL